MISFYLLGIKLSRLFRELGPNLLPVIRTKFLAAHLSSTKALHGWAVLRGNFIATIKPIPNLLRSNRVFPHKAEGFVHEPSEASLAGTANFDCLNKRFHASDYKHLFR